MEQRVFSGHKFVKVGEFVKSETPLQITFEGKPSVVSVELKLYQEDFRKIGESVYMVTVNARPVYVGEYSGTLESRWLKNGKGSYIWHNRDVDIVREVDQGNKLDFYLARDVFALTSTGKRVNIAKSIEHDILQDKDLDLWNKRNVAVDTIGHREILEFIGECWK